MGSAIAIIAPGAMGSAVGRRLADHGVTVLTALDGRSEPTRNRAQAAGMIGVERERLGEAHFILSIVPPGEALAIAAGLQGVIAASARKPVFIDCNAVSVATVQKIAAIVAATGAPFIDGGIIGPPPRDGYDGPAFYLSGQAAPAAAMLGDLGLYIRILDAPIGAASALKMSYAGITKGLTAIASAMIIGAERVGAGEALHEELAKSQPLLLERFEKTLPDMFPKAHRWVAEMREISAFLAEDEAASMIYEGAARLYARLAEDMEGQRQEIGLLETFLKP